MTHEIHGNEKVEQKIDFLARLNSFDSRDSPIAWSKHSGKELQNWIVSFPLAAKFELNGVWFAVCELPFGLILLEN
jgi:hypothetical protein